MVKLIAVVVGFLLAAAVLALLSAWPFMWMWNYAVVSAVTVASPITYWPAFCLMLFLALFVTGGRAGGKSK